MFRVAFAEGYGGAFCEPACFVQQIRVDIHPGNRRGVFETGRQPALDNAGAATHIEYPITGGRLEIFEHAGDELKVPGARSPRFEQRDDAEMRTAKLYDRK